MYDNKIRRVYALDLPGHGSSGWPFGFFRYGSMRYYDYTKIIKDVLYKLRADYGNVEIIAGHSMGGQLLAIAQQELLNQQPAKSVLSEFGADRILLIAPIIPEQVAWLYADMPFQDRPGPRQGLFADLFPLLRLDLYLGLYATVDNPTFRRVFFTDCQGNLVPGSPSDAQIDQIGRTEPLFAALDAVGLFADRPHVAPAIFASPAYKMATTAYVNDYFFDFVEPDRNEERNLHNFLRGSAGAAPPGYFQDGACNAVHDSPYSKPESLDAALMYLTQ
jgi:pimeloyl-ACP methyl ester carboxylesterase